MYFKLSILALLILQLFACEESVEGCLDKRAANFDVDAVTACDSCCILPTASLDLSLMFDTLDFFLSKDYPLGIDDTIQLKSFKLAFSEFTFYGLNDPYFLEDTIRNYQPQNRDDYLVLETSTKKTIGHADFLVDVDSFQCRIGLDTIHLNTLKPYIVLNGSSQLVSVIGKMYNDTLDYFKIAEMELEIADSVRQIEVRSVEPAFRTFSADVALTIGQSWSVPLYFDVQKALKGISPDQSNEVLSETIGQNIQDALFVK